MPELNNFTFSYGKKIVLKNISISLEDGDFMCICGPNGCGKSTLLKNFIEEAFYEKSPKEKAKSVAFLPQKEEPLWHYSVFDTILSGRFCHTNALSFYNSHDKRICEKIMEDFGISNLRNLSIKEISGGEFQKVRIARAFVQESKYIILDEPLASLDFASSEKFMAFLREKCRIEKKTLLITIHDINLALRYFDKIFLLGKYNNKDDSQFFMQGSVSETATKENISKIYDANVSTFIHPLYNVIQVGL